MMSLSGPHTSQRGAVGTSPLERRGPVGTEVERKLLTLMTTAEGVAVTSVFPRGAP
jgi:hypothetical protein